MVPTSGRPTLERTLASCAWADQTIVVPDDDPVGDAARSNRLRDAGIAQADGDWILFMDDDDTFTPDAHQIVLRALAVGGAWHVFRMRYPHGHVLWADREIRWGNVGTPMLVVPNRPDLPKWAAHDVYEADFHFAAACQDLLGEPVWHEDVIALVRPSA